MSKTKTPGEARRLTISAKVFMSKNIYYKT